MKGCILKDSLSLSPQAVLRSYSNNRKSNGEGAPRKSKSPLKAILDSLNSDAVMNLYLS